MTTAAIPAAPARIRAVPAATKRPGLPGTLRSELTKILSVRSTYWTLLAQVLASIGWAVITCSGDVSHGIGPGFNAAQASLMGQVALGEAHIARQREILANLTRDGQTEAAGRAAELLAQFEQTQTLHVSDRDRLRLELAENSR